VERGKWDVECGLWNKKKYPQITQIRADFFDGRRIGRITKAKGRHKDGLKTKKGTTYAFWKKLGKNFGRGTAGGRNERERDVMVREIGESTE